MLTHLIRTEFWREQPNIIKASPNIDIGKFINLSGIVLNNIILSPDNLHISIFTKDKNIRIKSNSLIDKIDDHNFNIYTKNDEIKLVFGIKQKEINLEFFINHNEDSFIIEAKTRSQK